MHGSAATGTVPKVAVRWRRQRKLLAALGREELVCQRQEPFAEAVGEQAIVADAHESPGQHMQEEAAQELHCGEGHDALLVSVRIIPPAEAYPLSVEGQQAMVGYGHAVGVAAEVAQDMGRSAEGRLGIDEPSLAGQPGGQILEPGRITECGCRTTAIELALAVELP